MRLLGLLAFLFLAAAGLLALYSWYGSWRVEQDYPPLGQFVNIGGTRLHFVEAGHGPAVVFIHGASATLRDFLASDDGHKRQAVVDKLLVSPEFTEYWTLQLAQLLRIRPQPGDRGHA